MAYFARVATLAFIVVSLVLSSVLPANAQAGGTSGNINGTVLSATGAPVAGATVAIASPSGTFTQQTDTHGFFSLLGVPPDSYVISVEAQGFAAFTQSGVTVTGSGTLALGALHLVTRSELTTIGTVSAHSLASAFQANQTVPQYTISGSVLQAAAGKSSNASEQSILLSVPGFQNDYRGNLILQGATLDQIRYQFDGVDFTDPGFSNSANSRFFNAISSVQVVPGAGDPSQGNGGAGVVNLLVKRGTYPAGGSLDLELNDRPEGQQINLQYGAATQNGRFSDYFSYFGDNGAYQFGPFGSAPYDNNAIYLNSKQGTSDFVNNFVFRFGNENSQSLQVLYLAHAYTVYGNYGGLFPLNYDDGDIPTSATVNAFDTFTGGPPLTLLQTQQIMGFEQGQTYFGQAAPAVAGIGNTNLLKFEYDNQISGSTSLALRFFHSQVFDYAEPSASGTSLGNGFAPYGQTSGGSRVGANFDLNQQIGQHNTLTFSGNYVINHPNFGAVDAVQGEIALAGNVIDFLTPPNRSAPVSAANPCPIAGGCYLQQFFYNKPGGVPQVPNLYLNSQQPNLAYGTGLRDQYQVTNNLRLDLGVRYDTFSQMLTPGYVQSEDENTQPVPGNPGATYIPNYGFVNHPHYLQPRLGLSFLITKNDTLSATEGKSINLGGNGLYASPEGSESQFLAPFIGIPVNPNWINGAFNPTPLVGVGPTGSLCNVDVSYPIGAGPTTAPSYTGTTAGPNPTLQMGRGCQDYGDLLRSQLDLYFPEIVNIQPAVLYNTDLSFAHQFKGGMAMKIDGFNRQGYFVQQITAPVTFNPVTGTTSVGSLTSLPTGKNNTTGAQFNVTLPDRQYGFTGFASLTYTNELTNTPPVGDNPNGQDFEPFAPAVYSAVNNGQGNVYHAGFISPVTVHAGLSYKTRTGWRINPVLNFTDGFPYNAGSSTPFFLGNGTNYTSVNVPNTNITDGYSPSGAPAFVDPANPGSVYSPNISATRGNKEGVAGTQLSPPQATMDVTLEYTPPTMPRVTFGLQVVDVFNNGYYQHAIPNPNYYPVATGVSGPLTGQNPAGASFPGYAPLVSPDTYPYAPYTINPFFGPAVGTAGDPFVNLPTTYRVYLQMRF